MSAKIEFSELNTIMIRHGLNIQELSRRGKAARNTIKAIIAGKAVRVSTISKILIALEESGIDTAEARQILEMRQKSSSADLQPAGGTLALAVDNTNHDITSAARARLLRGFLDTAEQHTSDLLRRVQRVDKKVDQRDLQNILRLAKHIYENAKVIEEEAEPIDLRHL